jgi:hypothetical protein
MAPREPIAEGECHGQGQASVSPGRVILKPQTEGGSHDHEADYLRHRFPPGNEKRGAMGVIPLAPRDPSPGAEAQQAQRKAIKR